MTQKRNRVTGRALLAFGLLAATQCAIPEFHNPEGGDGSDLGGLGGQDGNTGGETASGGQDTGGSDGNTGGADATGGSGEDTGGSDGNTGGDATGGSGGTPATPCGSDGICAPPVPPDWEGPVAVATSGTVEPSCGGTDYGRTVLQKRGELDEGNPTCDCECGPPAAMGCSNMALTAYGTAIACDAVGGTTYAAQANGACQTGYPADRYYVASSTFSAGACTPDPTVEIPEPEWTERMTACGGDPIEGAECNGDEVCMPGLQAPLTTLCIYQDGEDQPCPSEGYTVQTTYYDDFTDERDCTTCSCGTATGSCEGTVTFTNVCGTGGGVVLVSEIDSNTACSHVIYGSSMAGTYSGPTADGSCPPEGGELTGTVTKTAPVTVCCMP